MTPKRYRSLATGVDLTGKSDADLMPTLDNAAFMVNSACHAPDGYSFLGGTVAREEHQWRVGNKYKQPSGRTWPLMRPLKDVSLLDIYVTRTQHVTFNPDQLFTQHALGYVEPVAAPNTMALFTSVPPWLLSSPVAYVDYDYGFDLFANDERLTTISGGILRASHQFWFTDEEVSLTKNGVLVAPINYTVDYDEGEITPTTPPTNEIWRASYHHHLPPGIAAATALVATDILGDEALARAGMLGVSSLEVEEVTIKQSQKINFRVQPVNAAALVYLGPYMAMFTSMR